MEKVIAVPDKRVKDLGGLYYGLKQAGFLVRNVGADQFGTYIHLEQDEEKDPVSMVEAWLDKPAPTLTRRALEERKELAKKAEEAARVASQTATQSRAAREAAMMREQAIQNGEAGWASLDAAQITPVEMVLPAPEPPVEKPGFSLSKAWRRIWGG